MKKSFLFWLAFGVASVIALYLVVRVTLVIIGTANIAPIGNITVQTNADLSATDITNAMTLSAGKSVYSANMNDALSKIMEIPDIKNAAVRRLPNGRMAVKVEQRKIVATWTDGVKFYPLAADGHVVQLPFAAKPDGMLVFSGNLTTDIGGILNAIKNAPSVAQQVSHLNWTDGRRWDMTTAGGITIRLPENGAIAAIARLNALQKQNSILDRSLAVIDMRDPERTLVVVSR
ncbi:MAG: cell division protein FtsQ/DivIB [Proteobacteria bacterium]|nr:cell division protein FtsQ/DivIB [Pseudomonadota bacterium]